MFKLITALNFNVACIACKTIWVYYIQISAFCAFLLCFFFLFPIRKFFCLPFYFTKKSKIKDGAAEKNDFF